MNKSLSPKGIRNLFIGLAIASAIASGVASFYSLNWAVMFFGWFAVSVGFLLGFITRQNWFHDVNRVSKAETESLPGVNKEE